MPVRALRNASKSFGATRALDGMTLELHAVVGENGAGKSTMIKVMTGVHPPTSGAVEVDGAPVAFSGPREAKARGISAIYQEPMVFPDLDVAENVFVVAPLGLLQRPEALRTHEVIGRIGMSLDPARVASGLTLAEQQAVEVARALAQDVRVLIMDEPTASLSAFEAGELRRVARTLAGQGVAVVYISHRLEEIFEVADRVSVIRDGRHVSTKPIGEVTAEGMIADMVGREVGNHAREAPSVATPEVVLSVEGLACEDAFEGVTFDLHRGEVLCLAGLIGARRTDVALPLFGIRPATGGRILWKGRDVRPRTAGEAMALGIAYVSEDRRTLGPAMPLSIRANVTLATPGNVLTRWGLLRERRERAVAEAYRRRLNIRMGDADAPMGRLSGGNQQKVMLAKRLEARPDLLILDEPTRGIDVGAKAEVHGLIRAFVREGGAALVISSDLPEVLALGDRVLVMREGRRMGILPHEEATGEAVMRLATGQRAA